MSKINRILFYAISVILLYSCSDNDTPQPTPYRATAFATITDKTSDATYLQWQQLRGSEKITLTTPQILDNNYTINSRVVIYFETPMSDTVARPMPITITNISRTFSGDITAIPHSDISDLRKAQAEILSQWLTDDYVNMQLKVDYDGNGRALALTADASTLQSDTITCYLYNSGEEVSENCVQRRAYASFPTAGLNLRTGQIVKVLLAE